MERCNNCKKVIVFGAIRSANGVFCSDTCEAGYQALQQGFCEACLAQTTDESPGNLRQINGIGTSWGFDFGGKDKCPTCGSAVKTKWFCFIFPLVPIDKFRVLSTQENLTGSRGRFLARKVKPGAAVHALTTVEAEHEKLVDFLNGKAICQGCSTVVQVVPGELTTCCRQPQVRFLRDEKGKSCTSCGVTLSDEHLSVNTKIGELYAKKGFVCSCGTLSCLDCAPKNDSGSPTMSCACGQPFAIRI